MKTVIIGSGAGGGIAAMVLARATGPNDHVIVLERGPHWQREHFSDDEIKFGQRAMINLDHRVSPRTWKHGFMGTTFRGRILPASQCVGGGTVHYAAMSFRLREDDFRPFDAFGPVPGGNVHDWPFGYDDIEPYYTRVEYLIGVQGLDAKDELGNVRTVTYEPREGGITSNLTLEGNQAQSRRSRQFPMLPGPGKIDNLLFAQAAKDMGLHPYPCPLAINSESYQSRVLAPDLGDPTDVEDRLDLRPACEQCGMCSGYGCPIDAKNSTLITAIELALRTGKLDLRPGCLVSRIESTRVGSIVRATAVKYLRFVRTSSGEVDPVPQEESIVLDPGDRVIVACDAIETPRLFLLSGLDEADRSHQLGRNLMTHHLPSATGFFPDLVNNHRGVYTTHVIDDLYRIPPEAIPRETLEALPPELRTQVRQYGLKGGVVAAAGPSAGEPIGIGGLVSLGQTLPWGEMHIPALQGAFGRQIFLGMVGDDVPQLQNRVTLDPSERDLYGLRVARVEQTPHPRDLAVLATAGPILQSILERAGAQVSATATATPPLYPSQYNHRMGTMRMGNNPATSVVDPDGRYHPAENIYVMDGSLMVSAGGYNPTETIQALAWMLAGRIA